MDPFTAVYYGLIASAAMFVLMELIGLSGTAKVDLIRVIGSFVSKRYEGSFWIGISIYLAFGALFGLIYTFFLSHLPSEDLTIFMISGALMGFAHGLFASYVILIEISEIHPLMPYRQSAFQVALSYIVGHILFGVLIGALYSQQFNGIQDGLADSSWMKFQLYAAVVGALLFIGLLMATFNNYRHSHGRLSKFNRELKTRPNELQTESKRSIKGSVTTPPNQQNDVEIDSIWDIKVFRISPPLAYVLGLLALVFIVSVSFMGPLIVAAAAVIAIFSIPLVVYKVGQQIRKEKHQRRHPNSVDQTLEGLNDWQATASKGVSQTDAEYEGVLEHRYSLGMHNTTPPKKNHPLVM